MQSLPGMSDSINEIASALSRAQGQIKTALHNAENPHFKSSYANLASVWDACRKALSDNNLAVTQQTSMVETGVNVHTFFLTTVLMHSSGQWISGGYPIEPVQKTPQGYGSATTYARRYALMALVGVAPDEEDDGHAATSNQRARDDRPAPAQQRNPAKPADAKAGNKGAEQSAAPKKWQMSEAQGKRLFAIANEAQWAPEQVKAYMKAVFKIESSGQLTYDQYQKLCLFLGGNPNYEAEMKAAAPHEAPPEKQKHPPVEDVTDEFMNYQETEEEKKF